MITLDQMIKTAEDQARRVLIGTKEELVPAWVMVSLGKAEIVATPWDGYINKQLVIEAMRALMRERQVQAYSLVVEAWFVTANAIDDEYTGPPPSERTDRKECVVAMAANKAGEHRHLHLEIIRDKKGRCVELRRLSPEDRITSWIFDNLLDDGRRMH